MWDRWRLGPRQIRLVFLAVMILLASMLGCVAWLLLEQDRQLAAQRLGERRDAAADLAVASLEKRISSIEQEIGRILTDKNAKLAFPSGGAAFVQLQPGSIRSWPDNALIYYPILPESPEAPDFPFAAADTLEFQAHDYAGAVAALHELALLNDTRI